MTRPCEQLDAYLDGSLRPEAAAEFVAHLPGCSTCEGELGRQRELDRLFRAAKDHLEQPPATLQVRVETALNDAERPRPRLRFVRFAPLAAAAVLLLGVMLLWALRGMRNTRAVTEGFLPPSPAARTTKASLPASSVAMAQLAVLATSRRVPRIRTALAWLDAPVFPQAATEVWLPPPVPAKARRDAEPKSEQEDRDGPKTGRLSKLNAVSLESLQTLGERRLDQTLVQPPTPPMKEEIPC